MKEKKKLASPLQFLGNLLLLLKIGQLQFFLQEPLHHVSFFLHPKAGENAVAQRMAHLLAAGIMLAIYSFCSA
jgi:hypothetical protein